MFPIRKIQEKVVFAAVSSASDAATAQEIVYGQEDRAKSEKDADWVKSTMHRLENRFDQDAAKRIRMNCQCGYGMDEKLTLLNELKAAATNMEEFGNTDRAKTAGMYCEDGILYLQFPFCPCPMLAEVDRLATYTWCQCTTGYSQVLFEQVFGCPVEVELLQSIKAGDDICLMSIIPCGQIWE